MLKMRFLIALTVGLLMMGAAACSKEPDMMSEPRNTAASEFGEPAVTVSTNGMYVTVPERWDVQKDDSSIVVNLKDPDPVGKIEVGVLMSDSPEKTAAEYNGKVIKKDINGRIYYAAVYQADGNNYNMRVFTDFSEDRVLNIFFNIADYSADDCKALLEDKTFSEVIGSLEGKPSEFRSKRPAAENTPG